MKTVLGITVLSLLLALSYGVSGVYAQTAGPAKPLDVEIVGVNFEMANLFAKDKTANVPAPLAQLNALRVSGAKDIMASAEIADIKGTIVFYAPTQAALTLMSGPGMQNKSVKLIGKLYKQERVLVVETIQAQGGEFDNLPVGNNSRMQVL